MPDTEHAAQAQAQGAHEGYWPVLLPQGSTPSAKDSRAAHDFLDAVLRGPDRKSSPATHSELELVRPDAKSDV